MNPARDDFTALRFSIDDFPHRDREEIFREIYGRTIMKIELEPAPDSPFVLDLQLRATQDFGMSFGKCSAVNCKRSARFIEGDDLVLVAALDGAGRFETGNREAAITTGQAVLTDSSKVGSFAIHMPSNLINFRFSFARLAPLLADIDTALMRPVPQHSEAMRLLLRYAESMKSDLTLASPELRGLIIAHFHDLAALALGAGPDAAAEARARGVGAARLHAIKADIVENIDAQDLSAAKLARRHGVSARYVNMLFEREPESLAEFVLRQRLLRAYRMLSDPRFADQTISAIAYRVGFGDISYFNRRFRQRFGATPSDIRARRP